MEITRRKEVALELEREKRDHATLKSVHQKMRSQFAKAESELKKEIKARMNETKALQTSLSTYRVGLRSLK